MNHYRMKCYFTASQGRWIFTLTLPFFFNLLLRHSATPRLHFHCAMQFPKVATRAANKRHSRVTDALAGASPTPPPALPRSSPTRPWALLQNQRQFCEQLPAKWAASEPHYLITSTGRGWDANDQGSTVVHHGQCRRVLLSRRELFEK